MEKSSSLQESNQDEPLMVCFRLRAGAAQTEKLDAVRTVEQVWTYLIGTCRACVRARMSRGTVFMCSCGDCAGEKDAERKDAGLLAKLFQEQWYNGAFPLAIVPADVHSTLAREHIL